MRCLRGILSFLATVHLCEDREGKAVILCSFLVDGKAVSRDSNHSMLDTNKIDQQTLSKCSVNNCYNEMWWEVPDHGVIHVLNQQYYSTMIPDCQVLLFSIEKTFQNRHWPRCWQPCIYLTLSPLEVFESKVVFSPSHHHHEWKKMDQNGASSYSRFRHGLSLRACFND